MQLTNYIIRWASMENIVCRDFGLRGTDRLYLDREGLDQDPCNQIPIDQCSQHSNARKYEDPNLRCRLYTSKKKDSQGGEERLCVSRYRVKAYEGTEKSLPVRSRLKVRRLKLLDTIPYDLTGDDDYDQTIYAHVISHEWYERGERRIDLYILFNCAKVYNMKILWTAQFNRYLNIFYQDYIFPYRQLYDKVIIAGHSAGCVSALRLGYFLYNLKPNHDHDHDQLTNPRQFFLDKCVVIGSGPFCWLPKTDTTQFTNLPNIKIFLNATQHQSGFDGSDRYFIDPIYFNLMGDGNRERYRGEENYRQYYPISLIYTRYHRNNRYLDISNKIHQFQLLNLTSDKQRKELDIQPILSTQHAWDHIDPDYSKECYYYKIMKYYGVFLKNKHRGGNYAKYLKYFHKYKLLAGTLPEWYTQNFPKNNSAKIKKPTRKTRIKDPDLQIIPFKQAIIKEISHSLYPKWWNPNKPRQSYPQMIDNVPEKTRFSSYQSGVADIPNQALWSKQLQIMKSYLGIKKRGQYILKKGTILFHSSTFQLPYHRIKLDKGGLFFGLSSLISIWYAAEKFSYLLRDLQEWREVLQHYLKIKHPDHSQIQSIKRITNRIQKMESIRYYLNVYRLEQDLTILYIGDNIAINQEDSRNYDVCFDEKTICLHPQYSYHSIEQLYTKRGPVELDFELTIPTKALGKTHLTPLAVYPIDVHLLLHHQLDNIIEWDPIKKDETKEDGAIDLHQPLKLLNFNRI